VVSSDSIAGNAFLASFPLAVFGSDFNAALESGAAALLINPGQPATLHAAGEVRPLPGGSVWSAEKIEDTLRQTLTPWQSERLESRGWTAGASALVDGAIWGMRVKRLAAGAAVELRKMPTDVPTIEDLYLPSLVGHFAGLKSGLVLVTGIGRSGRSRTLAAIVDRVNRTRQNRIITLEEPILYLHQRRQSVVEQRQIAIDVPDFASALDQALQDNPEVLAVSDLSDRETLATALAAAEHSLIFGRVTSANPVEAVRKLTGFFPPHEQDKVRSLLAANLAGVVALVRLEVPRGHHPVSAAGAINADEHIRRLLVDPELTHHLDERFEVDSSTSNSFRASVLELHKHGKISESVAAKYRTRAAAAATAVVAVSEHEQSIKR